MGGVVIVTDGAHPGALRRGGEPNRTSRNCSSFAPHGPPWPTQRDHRLAGD